MRRSRLSIEYPRRSHGVAATRLRNIRAAKYGDDGREVRGSYREVVVRELVVLLRRKTSPRVVGGAKDQVLDQRRGLAPAATSETSLDYPGLRRRRSVRVPRSPATPDFLKVASRPLPMSVKNASSLSQSSCSDDGGGGADRRAGPDCSLLSKPRVDTAKTPSARTPATKTARPLRREGLLAALVMEP